LEDQPSKAGPVSEDFRQRRFKLPPEAFALGPEEEPPPSDLIDERTWQGIVVNPDDVSFRTSDHHGRALRFAYDVWGDWVTLVLDVQGLVSDPPNDALALTCLNTTDELQASIWAALTGFYRQAIGGLRGAVEGALVGAYFRIVPNPDLFEEWVEGAREGQLWVKEIRRALLAVGDPWGHFETEDASLLSRSGWVNSLYGRLSAYGHARPFYTDDGGRQVPTTNVEMWLSNGPVYVEEAFRLWANLFLDAASMCVLMSGVSEPGLLELAKPAGTPFRDFARRLIEAHPGPHPVVKPIAEYLM
jgi:hypothetical protein